MRRTVNRLRFIPDGKGNFRSCECEFGWDGSMSSPNTGDIVIDKPTLILTVMKYIGAKWSVHKAQTLWFRDVYTNFEYPVKPKDFEKMIPHIQEGYILGLFNPTTNSAGRHTLEYIDVKMNITQEEKNA